jgi:hypothetical protein
LSARAGAGEPLDKRVGCDVTTREERNLLGDLMTSSLERSLRRGPIAAGGGGSPKRLETIEVCKHGMQLPLSGVCGCS